MSPWFCKSAVQLFSVSPTVSSVGRTLGMVYVRPCLCSSVEEGVENAPLTFHTA